MERGIVVPRLKNFTAKLLGFPPERLAQISF